MVSCWVLELEFYSPIAKYCIFLTMEGGAMLLLLICTAVIVLLLVSVCVASIATTALAFSDVFPRSEQTILYSELGKAIPKVNISWVAFAG